MTNGERMNEKYKLKKILSYEFSVVFFRLNWRARLWQHSAIDRRSSCVWCYTRRRRWLSVEYIVSYFIHSSERQPRIERAKLTSQLDGLFFYINFGQFDSVFFIAFLCLPNSFFSISCLFLFVIILSPSLSRRCVLCCVVEEECARDIIRTLWGWIFKVALDRSFASESGVWWRLIWKIVASSLSVFRVWERQRIYMARHIQHWAWLEAL